MKQKTIKRSIKNKYCFPLMLLLVLAACASSKSPVSSRSTVDRFSESEKIGGRIITIVQPGDTWYGIAFANNIDISELTAWNAQSESDKLMTGQRLRLTKPLGFQSNKSRSSVGSIPSSEQNKNTRIVEVRPESSRAPSVGQIESKQQPLITKVPASPNRNVPASPTKNQVQQFKQTQFTNKPVQWVWPLKGKVVSKFSPNLGRKGIDISGKQNQAVKVAAAGKVVYQGNGVKGYRNLIIIKHNENLLSAYAHNQQVYVQEGQWVSAKQTISTVGLKNGKPLLHFEIRRKGKPVDPLRYLGS